MKKDNYSVMSNRDSLLVESKQGRQNKKETENWQDKVSSKKSIESSRKGTLRGVSLASYDTSEAQIRENDSVYDNHKRESNKLPAIGNLSI